MNPNYELYVARAKAAEDAAESAGLPNVRERELRSAKAWRDMADRQLMIEAERVKAEEVRAERRAAEQALAEARADAER